MSHQVPWSRKVIDVFAEEMLLSDEEIFLLESRAKGWTNGMSHTGDMLRRLLG